MPKKISVFISSKMDELREERRVLGGLLPQLGGETYQIESWIFESDAIASASSIREVYLDALDNSDLYIGIFWNEYGEWTVDEFRRAGEAGVPRHIYVKNVDTQRRDPQLTQFLEKESDVRFGITPRWYTDIDDFKKQVARSIEQWLQNREMAYHSTTNAILANQADDIPDLPRRLIGRRTLIQRVRRLLEDDERVLLRGFGGTGKTALAATIAADYLDEGADQVIWIRAGSVDADGIYDAIGRAFERQQEVLTAEENERTQVVRRVLAEHKGLLVLDDVWNGSALAAVMRAVPRRMPALVTSRQRFPLDEIIEIGEMDADDALNLLNYHARSHYDGDADARKLCELLGNHAFALEIAAKTLKVYNLSPAELLKRIREAPHDLHMPAGFGELGRKGIKSLLDASIDALTRNLYEAYVTMGGMFEATATAEMVSRVMEEDKAITERDLQELVQRGLINLREQNGVRYFHMHDLGYSYARNMFLNQGKSHQKVITAYHDYVQAHVNDLPELDVEYGAILEAAETAQQNEQYGIVVDIMKALAVDGTYFTARGHTLRSLGLMQAAIDRALEAGEKLIAHHLLSKLGNAYAGFLGDLDQAIIHYQHALRLAQEMGNAQREAILLTVIGTVRFRQGAVDSDNYHQLAEAIARSEQDDVVLCHVLSNRGAQAVHHNNPNPDYEQGRRYSEEAARLAQANGLDSLYFYALLNRGSAEQELGQHHTAIRTHQEAFKFAQSQYSYLWMAEALHGLGEDYHKLGQTEQAQANFEEALRRYEDCGAKARTQELKDIMGKYGYQTT